MGLLVIAEDYSKMERPENSHPGSIPTLGGEHSFLSLYLQNLAARLSKQGADNRESEGIPDRNTIFNPFTSQKFASNRNHFHEEEDVIPKAEIADIDVKVEITEEDTNGGLESPGMSNHVKLQDTEIKKEINSSPLHPVEFKCWECLKVFKKERYLKMHIREVHTEAPMALCHICSKEFKHFHLKKHIQNVHIKEECSCDECGKIYTNKKHLRDHKKAVHEGLELLCHLCTKTFKSKSYLSNHVRRFHNCIDEELVCDYCSKIFKTQNKLYLHVKAVHTIENLPCHECGKIYKNSYLLRKHIKHNHTRQKSDPPEENPLLPPGNHMGHTNGVEYSYGDVKDRLASQIPGVMQFPPQVGGMMQFPVQKDDAPQNRGDLETNQARELTQMDFGQASSTE